MMTSVERLSRALTWGAGTESWSGNAILVWEVDMPRRWIENSQEITNFLDRALVGRLDTSLGDQPYVTPVAFVLHDGCIYFHSRPEGRKIDNIRTNPQVCFEIDALDKVHMVSAPVNTACATLARSL